MERSWKWSGTVKGKSLRYGHFHVWTLKDQLYFILAYLDRYLKKNIIFNQSNGNSKRIIAVSGQQIKSISIDFCDLYSESCEKCLKSNTNTYYSSQCYWSNNACQSKPKLEYLRSMNYSIIGNLEKCSMLLPSKNSFANTTKTFFRIQPSNATAKSSLIYKNATAFLRNQPTKTPSITFADENEYILSNLSSSLFKIVENQSQQAKAQTLDANYSQMNTMNFYIIISIIGSIIGLFIGLLSGFIIKANYSKKLTNFISNKFSASKNCQHSIKKKEMKIEHVLAI
jgi:hypothetical protein